MKSPILLRFALCILAVCWTVPGWARQEQPAAEPLERAYKLMSDGRWAEAAEAARGYLQETGPEGTASKEARILLCQARSHLPDEPLPPGSQVSDKDTDPFRVGGAVTRPEILYQIKPVYTEQARQARTTGTVIVEAIIDEEGCVRNVRELKGLPDGLTEATVEVVRGWVFSPATLEGRPVKVYYVLTVNFYVQAQPPPLLRRPEYLSPPPV
jgi:TonB family protein